MSWYKDEETEYTPELGDQDFDSFDIETLPDCCGWYIISYFEKVTNLLINKRREKFTEELKLVTSAIWYGDNSDTPVAYPVMATLNKQQRESFLGECLTEAGFKCVNETINPNTDNIVSLYIFMPEGVEKHG